MAKNRSSADDTAYVLWLPDGRRTRRYLTLAAAQHAAARGEVYTEAEYKALSTPQHQTKRGKK